MIAESSRSLGPCRGPFTNQRIKAPPARAVEANEEEDPAIKHGELTLVGKLGTGTGDREKLRHWCSGIGHMYHEVGHGHFAAGDERANASKQTKRDEKSTNKLDPAAGLCERIIRTGHAAKHAEDQLPSVRREHESYNQSHDTVNRIRKSI